MIISLDKYKATGGGSGGNTEVVNSGDELTMKEFIEVLRKMQEQFQADYAYNTVGNGSGEVFTFLKTGSVIPYTSRYGTIEPLHEVYYDSNNGQFDFIRNENGDVANVITTDAFTNIYQQGIYTGRYSWKYNSDSGNGKIKDVVSNKLIKRVSDFYSHELSQYNFGYCQLGDMYGNYGWVKPFDYYVSEPIGPIEEDGYSWSVYLYDNDENHTIAMYSDQHDVYGYDYEIKGVVTALPATSEYAWVYDNVQYYKIRTDKCVSLVNSGDDVHYIDFFDTNSNYESSKKLEINELAYMYGDVKMYSRYSATGNRNYYCPYNIGNLDYNLELYNFSSDNSLFSFTNINKPKTINIKLDGYDESKIVYIKFQGCTNLEKINIEYNGLVKIKSGEDGYNIDNKTQYFPSLASMFYNCKSLTSIPQIDSSEVGNMSEFIHGCISLKSLPLLDASSLQRATYIFGFEQLNNLTDFGGFKNLSVDCKDTFYYCPNLTVESLMNVINNLATVSGKTLQLGSHHLNKLTAEQIAVATSKGWTLT